MSPPLLSVQALSLEFATRRGPVPVLDRLDLDLARGEVTGLIGESGSGKSVLAHAVMGISDRAARIRSGRVLFDGQDLLTMTARAREGWRGRQAAIIFQNPRAALNPIRSVGAQIADVIGRHDPVPAREVRARTLEMLRQVRFPDPERRLRAYPHQLSGGQCQRIGIAVALAGAPRLLIADEPTTGLDVTTQAAILELIRALARQRGLAVLLITHDLALAAQSCDRLAVIHAGQMVEVAPAATLLARPRHPYTARLLRAAPALARTLAQLQPIGGALPGLQRGDLPPCRFAERCPRRIAACDAGPLRLQALAEDPAHLLACRNPPDHSPGHPLDHPPDHPLGHRPDHPSDHPPGRPPGPRPADPPADPPECRPDPSDPPGPVPEAAPEAAP